MPDLPLPIPTSTPSVPANAPRLSRWLQRLEESLPAAMLKRFIDADLLAQSAALSFYSLISLAPLLLLLLWITASLYPSAQAALLDQIAALGGPQAREVASTVLSSASNRPDLGSVAGVWSTLLLFVGATVVFAQLQATLNKIFATETAAGAIGMAAWLRKRVFSFGVVFALGFLLLVSMMLTTALQVVFARLPSVLPVIGNAVTLGLYLAAFALLYHYLPDRRVRWRQALLGGALTAPLFVAGRWAIGVYLVHAEPGGAYGVFGTLVLLLVWIYYAAVVFFSGALITAVIDERLTRPPSRNP